MILSRTLMDCLLFIPVYRYISFNTSFSMLCSCSLFFIYFLLLSLHFTFFFFRILSLFFMISCPFIERWLYPAAHMWRDHTHSHINSYRARVQLCFKLRLASHCGVLGEEVKGFRLSTQLDSALATCCAFSEHPQSAYASFTHTFIYIYHIQYI